MTARHFQTYLKRTRRPSRRRRLVDEPMIFAAQRADTLLEQGDMDGRRVWLRVLEAVKELSEIGPQPGKTVHRGMSVIGVTTDINQARRNFRV